LDQGLLLVLLLQRVRVVQKKFVEVYRLHTRVKQVAKSENDEMREGNNVI
jgi:hypothetical protein